MIILDTDVVSEPLRPQPDARVVDWLDSQQQNTLYLTAVTLAELLAGVEVMPHGKRKDALREALGSLLFSFFDGHILPFDREAAGAFASIMRETRAIGRNLTIADAQIAAIARSKTFSVATRDVEPFLASGVRVINPRTG